MAFDSTPKRQKPERPEDARAEFYKRLAEASGYQHRPDYKSLIVPDRK